MTASRQRLQGLIKGPWLGILAAFGLFLLSRPYQGVRHDARLYVADAMAKAGWGDIGKDLMFVNDGQFGFSLYTPMLSKLIQGLGLQAGTLAIVVVTLLLWFAAATFLVQRLLADRPPAVRWAALVFLVALPPLYGPMDVISFGEPLATPRGLAEAAGLAGMGVYLSGRRFLALAVCGLGMVFHPIMGLCSAAAIAMAMCLEDRRWLWAGLVGLALLTVAGLLHLPVAERIVTVMDPDWRAVVEARSPVLFPMFWKPEAWSRMAAQACTVAAGALLLSGAPRRLALGALIAGLVGVVAVEILADRLSLLLFLQVQTWRMLQPMAVLSTICLALLAIELPRRGPAGWLSLSFLVAAWLFRDMGDLGLIFAPVGLLLALLGDRLEFSRPKLFTGIAIGFLALSIAFYGAVRGLGLLHALSNMPTAWPFSQGLVWNSVAPGLVVATVIAVWIGRGWRAPSPGMAILAVAAIGGLAALTWDDRSDYVRHRDEGLDPALAAMTAGKPGEVLWLVGDMEPWELIGRPSWASKVQSAGVVFSRPLAMGLRDRVGRLRAGGFVGDDWMRPLSVDPTRPPAPRLDQVRAFCAAKDAPAWIVWPRWTPAALDQGLQARDWSPKAPYALELVGNIGGNSWLIAPRYAVIPCAGG
ncbi:hypothetical protein [Caulobacter sp. SSI4214]|uniref:hypothetical protein n=1 Tax=Caulobacter sp. SSI4214 TaxID=2575739 RepID=UPI0014395DAF|nr:hypothetical protein [Caulobacter sp. SSI4214]